MNGLINFETNADGGDPGGAPPPAEATPPPFEAPAAATPEWQGPTREEWEQTQGYLQQTAPFLNELQSLLQEEQAPAQQQPDAAADPQAYLDQLLEQKFAERFGAFEPVLGQIAEREGEAAARAELDRIASDGGDFDRELALIVAQQSVERMPPADALRAGAEFARQAAERIGKSAVEAHLASLTAAATAPNDIGAPGSAIPAPEVAKGRDRYEETLQRHFSNMNPVNPAG